MKHFAHAVWVWLQSAWAWVRWRVRHLFHGESPSPAVLPPAPPTLDVARFLGVGPGLGAPVRFEGAAYRISDMKDPICVIEPEDPSGPWHHVTLNRHELVLARAEEYAALVAKEAAELTLRASESQGRRRQGLEAFAAEQVVELPARFAGATEDFWYLPGRGLERHRLRALK